jgi:hypothetical protein
MLLRFRESTFAVGARCLVQLVLGPDSIDNSATGGGGNKDCQYKDRQYDDGDPGLREFHLSVTPIY